MIQAGENLFCRYGSSIETAVNGKRVEILLCVERQNKRKSVWKACGICHKITNFTCKIEK